MRKKKKGSEGEESEKGWWWWWERDGGRFGRGALNSNEQPSGQRLKSMSVLPKTLQLSALGVHRGAQSYHY